MGSEHHRLHQSVLMSDLIDMPVSMDGEQWCDRHWQPFLEDSTAKRGSGLLATVFMANALLWDEEFMRSCGWDPEHGIEADADRINEEIEKLNPLCCHFGDKAMLILRIASMTPEYRGGSRG